MKAARIVVLGVAVVAGGLAAVMAGRQSPVQAPPPPESVAKLDTTDVLVAKSDIGIGQSVSASEMQWRTSEAFDPKQLKTDRRADNIDDCVQRANFMEVHVLNRFVVYSGFSLGQTRKDLRGSILHGLTQTRVVNDLQNVAQVTMRMFVLSVYASVRGTNARTIDGNKVDLEALNSEQV